MSIAHIIEKSVRDGFSVIPEIDAQTLLKGYGIACPATELVTTRDECIVAGERIGFPLTFHIAAQMGGMYGLYDEPGLPQLEQSLATFPKLNFLGHSQTFWAEMGPICGSITANRWPAERVL